MLDQLIEFVNGDISDLKSSASPKIKAPRVARCFYFIQAAGLAWSHALRVWNPHSGMASPLVHHSAA